MATDDGTAAANTIIAFVLGAAVGAAVAVLMAPASGEDTRRVLGEKAREGRERAEEAARQGRQFLNDQRETLNAAIARGREAYQQARSGGEQSQATGTPDTL